MPDATPQNFVQVTNHTGTMSSGFVSGGTTDEPTERSDEWLAAQKELEANRQRKAEQARQADGRSLYETLEANKGTIMTGTDVIACEFGSWTDHAGVL
jgi:FAM192A/Fyv6, N-terminal domain